MNRKSNIGQLLSLSALMAVVPMGGAFAQEFEGAYVGVEGGIGITKTDGSTFAGPISESDNSGLIGGVLGYRAPVGADGGFVLSVEGTMGFYSNGSNERYGVYGIGGYRVGDRGLAYMRVGYGWLGGVQTGVGDGIDGLVYGGGYEFGLRERMNLRLDYRYLDYGGVNIPDNTLDFKGHEITAAVLFNF